ncbi:MAG: beta-phosphoglucomutase [Saprospiraceae bacterium]|nr:beta-phosphoglucomutase [Saprospiraceae bacterium]MCB0542270.1 beta-phosphoglucomutase [Saprospiraceae bacterium]MCB0574027.1 beta-phosphoglucomutase [Saprospiraceae bacterium]MCB9307527.1 beta-phosphoglucomutase [Lewinellaceae bacterium]MCB9356489.1 beta-phosphoglucomutase [Lewinellaceae bacterium]
MTGIAAQKKGCIFNLDGVIVDTSRYHYVAWKRLCNQLGFDFTPEQHEKLRGLSRMASLEQLLEWGNIYMTEAEKLHWSDVKNNWYVEMISDLKPGDVLPGAILFLRQVREAGLKVALASASRSARQVLNTTRLDAYFDAIIDGNSTRKAIPDPECYLLAARALGLEPFECFIFEDSDLGVLAGVAGGFFVIGVGDPDYLSKAHMVIPGFENLSYTDLLTRITANMYSHT